MNRKEKNPPPGFLELDHSDTETMFVSISDVRMYYPIRLDTKIIFKNGDSQIVKNTLNDIHKQILNDKLK